MFHLIPGNFFEKSGNLSKIIKNLIFAIWKMKFSNFVGRPWLPRIDRALWFLFSADLHVNFCMYVCVCVCVCVCFCWFCNRCHLLSCNENFMKLFVHIIWVLQHSDNIHAKTLKIVWKWVKPLVFWIFD